MLSFSGNLRVFLAVEPCDMRKGYEGLPSSITEKTLVLAGLLLLFFLSPVAVLWAVGAVGLVPLPLPLAFVAIFTFLMLRPRPRQPKTSAG